MIEALDGAVGQEAFECSNAVERALYYIASAMFSKLRTLVENSQLYNLNYEEMNSRPECQKEAGRLLPLLGEVSLRLTEVVDVTRLQALTTQVVMVKRV